MLEVCPFLFPSFTWKIDFDYLMYVLPRPYDFSCWIKIIVCLDTSWVIVSIGVVIPSAVTG